MKSYVTPKEVAEKLDIEESDIQSLLTKEKLKLTYAWTPRGIRISRKSFEDVWGDYEKAENAESTASDETQQSSGYMLLMQKAMDLVVTAAQHKIGTEQLHKFIDLASSLTPQKTSKVKKVEVSPCPVIVSEENKAKLKEYLKSKSRVTPKEAFSYLFPDIEYTPKRGAAIGRIFKAFPDWIIINSNEGRSYIRKGE